MGDGDKRYRAARAIGAALWLAAAAAFAPGDEPAIWSVAPVVRPEAPAVRDAAWPSRDEPAAAIDRFVLAALEAKQMHPAPRASRPRLIRRLYFDLWGLPPAPEAVAEFAADDRPEAYAELVDKLLASPHYGERWARYWLDLVRYADTNGYERDAEKKNSWRYRDWVIEALNSDKPYDEFLVDQLAGDQRPDADEASRIATGFLRVGTLDDEPNDPLVYRYEQLDDLMRATGTVFLGLTIHCARCHDHKFDPISQQDYYGLLNFFVTAKPADGELLAVADTGERPLVKLLASGDPRAEQHVVPAAFLSMTPDWRPSVALPSEGPVTGLRLQLARWIASRQHPLTARVAVNRLWQHHFGAGLVRTPDNFGNMGDAPTHPELLDWLSAEFMQGGWRAKRLHRMILLSSAYQMDSTHTSEAAYAEIDPANERLWKANRRRLDADALRDAMLAVGGRLDERLGGPGFVPELPPEAVEGLSMKDGAWRPSPPEDQRRRSIYLFVKRSLLPPLLTVFDMSDTTQPCSERTVTTVAPQALALLNNPFSHEASAALAARVAAEAGTEPRAQIERAWRLAFGRDASSAELDAALAHVAAQRERSPAAGEEADRRAMESLCHVLLNANEFLYVD